MTNEERKEGTKEEGAKNADVMGMVSKNLNDRPKMLRETIIAEAKQQKKHSLCAHAYKREKERGHKKTHSIERSCRIETQRLNQKKNSQNNR